MLTVTLIERSWRPIRITHMTMREGIRGYKIMKYSNKMQTIISKKQKWKTQQSIIIKIDRRYFLQILFTDIKGHNSPLQAGR